MPQLATDPVSSFSRHEVPTSSQPVPLWRSLVVVMFALIVGLTSWIRPSTAISPQSGVVMQLPAYVDGFVGRQEEITEVERRILPKDTEFARKSYRNYSSTDDRIVCSIVLSGAEQRSIHRPEGCLTAQGWSIVNQEDLPVQLPSGHRLVVRNLTLKRTQMIHGENKTITEYNMYWFVGEKITTPSHLVRVFLTSWDRIVHNRAHRWAYVTASAFVTDNLQSRGLNAAQTQTLLLDFIRAAVPTFEKSEMEKSAP